MILVYRVDRCTAGNIICVSITDDTIILYTVDKTIIIRFRRGCITKNIGIPMIEYTYMKFLLTYILDDIPVDRCIL